MRILPSGWRSTTIVMRSEVASFSMTSQWLSEF